ncbi:MAG: hypothetical protein ACYTF1_04330 [Planctomycetota bacterium]
MSTRVILTAVTYRQLTDEDRLRRFAERWLEDFTGGEAIIDQVRFDMFRGLDLVGVKLAVAESPPFDPQDNTFEGRTIFRSSTLFFRLNPFSIVSGELVVPEIVAVDPELTLLKRKSDGLANWEVMFRQRKKKPVSRWSGGLPEIRMRNVRLKQYRLSERGRSGGAAQTIKAMAQPLTGNPDVYKVSLSKVFSRPDSSEITGERGEIEINLSTMSVSGRLPTMTIEELLFSASGEINNWLDVLALRGYVRPETFSYQPQSTTKATLSLRDASFSIPLNAHEQQLSADERYLQFEGMAGTISFADRDAHIELEGRFRQCTLFIRGDMCMDPGVPAGLDGIGFDLKLSVYNLPLPRGDQDSAAPEVRFVNRWDRLKKFVRDFDGVGPVDLSVILHKSPGADYGTEFVEGTLIARGVSARYFRFPYRVDNLTGLVHFRKDKNIELKDLAGTHGRGRVVVNGVMGGYSSQFGRLDILGENIDLDDNLFQCLSDRDQRLCRLFDIRATMNLKVQLKRRDAPPGTKGNPWKPAIEVEFIDGAVNFARFRYPLNQLSGKMRIAGGRFEIDELTAARGSTKVRATGRASRSGDGKVQLDMQMEGTDVGLDRVLADALPDDTRKVFEQFAPTGTADLTGRLFSGDDSGKIEYDFLASLTDAGLGLPDTEARLTSATGEIRIRSEGLDIESLKGNLGRSEISLKGHFRTRPDQQAMSFELSSAQLLLDDNLRNALPDKIRKTWDMFEPSGQVALDMHYDRRMPAASQPALAQADPPIDYEVKLEPLGCSATFDRFSLPLSGITGTLIIEPDKIVIEKIKAQHEEMKFDLSGKIDLKPSQTAVALAVEATDLRFTEALRQAVPWRLRRMWNDVKPQGSADLSLKKLAFSIQPGKVTCWDFEGRVNLKDLSINIGAELSDIRGRLDLAGSVGSQFSCQGDLALPQIRVDRRLVTEVSARISRPPDDPVFRLEDIVGRFYEGTIAGKVEVDYSSATPVYGVSLAAGDVSLAEFLNAKRRPEEKPVKLKGLVNGSLDLAGKFGIPQSRRGGGAIVIRESQMFKVPLLLAILQVVHFAIDDNNAFHDGTLAFMVDGDELILNEIDLRGRSFSMIGAGRVKTADQALDLTLLIGSPLRLPKVQVLTELLEGVARELVEVHVEGTLDKPVFRAEIVRSLKKTIEAILNARRIRSR